jgi:hypothetical protein
MRKITGSHQLFTDSEDGAMSWNGKPEAESVTDLKMEA